MTEPASGDCGSCARIRDRDAGTAPFWDAILRTDHWDLAHCYDTSLPGWLVLISRRHIESIDELKPEEARELGELLRQTSIALKAEIGCSKTYVMQFAEHPQHPHVHFHVVPRMDFFPQENIGAGVFAYLGASEDERVDDATMNELAERLQPHLRQ